MLVGIVVTNAIVLMDLINHYRRQGMGVQEAVIEGGRHRLRPILMTAIATIFALLPMALGLTGEGGFISQPLAIVVIGGLVSSTLLTLVLVPTLYTMVENRREKSRAKRAARRQPAPGWVPPAKHAAAEPTESGDLVPAGTADAGAVPDDASRPTSGGGAHQAPERETAEPRPEPAAPSTALRGYTDQFEVLKMPRRPAGPSA
jgi:hydrophobic/amphiphilic exporter-1 (mainly G- bacteria), HAE1 family